MSKNLIGLLGVIFSISAYANDIKPMACKKFPILPVKQEIAALDKNFNWNKSDCKVIGTRSFFPQEKNGVMRFAKGLQIFVYQNYELKFICFPKRDNTGWGCNSWEVS